MKHLKRTAMRSYKCTIDNHALCKLCLKQKYLKVEKVSVLFTKKLDFTSMDTSWSTWQLIWGPNDDSAHTMKTLDDVKLERGVSLSISIIIYRVKTDRLGLFLIVP